MLDSGASGRCRSYVRASCEIFATSLQRFLHRLSYSCFYLFLVHLLLWWGVTTLLVCFIAFFQEKKKWPCSVHFYGWNWPCHFSQCKAGILSVSSWMSFSLSFWTKQATDYEKRAKDAASELAEVSSCSKRLECILIKQNLGSNLARLQRHLSAFSKWTTLGCRLLSDG